ncbi:MAG: glycosyltransferase [Planctomycetes bacterium]|jgi:glycosyltransferase involved in cell wall biosynthesis|nr:glycosyltransferase [Planctomycetota bacterium]
MSIGFDAEATIGRILMLLGNGYDPDPRVRAEALALSRAGLRVSVLAWDRDGASRPEEEMEGVSVTRIGPRSTHGRGRGQSGYLLRFWARAVRTISRQRFDILWCHDLDMLPVGVLLGGVRSRPVVFDAHESYPDMVAGSVGPGWTAALRWLERHLARRVSAVVTVGERLAAKFRGMGARRTVVAGNWKDPAEYRVVSGSRAAARKRYGVPLEAWLVTSIGFLGAERKLAELIAAVEGLPDAHVLIGGRGPLEEACRSAAGPGGRVHFAGWVPPAEVPALTAAGDAVFYGFDPASGNARYSAPNKLFEALAAGLPVITGPFGEIEEVVRAYGCGVVIPDYRPASIRDGLSRARGGTSFSAGCRRAAERYCRARADEAVRTLAASLLGAAGAPA